MESHIAHMVYRDRKKWGGRSFQSVVEKHLEAHAERLGIPYEQRKVCMDAASWVGALVLPDIEVDTEHLEHAANWLVAHVRKTGNFSPIDHIVFATYINTAAVRDPSLYPKN